MYIHKTSVCTAIVLYIIAIQSVAAYFGLAARKRILTDNLRVHPNVVSSPREKLSAVKLCDMLQLQRKQRMVCVRDSGVAETLLEATDLSSLECEHQFKGERWNCTMHDTYRLNILRKGFKETSFLYAITSASLVHTFARACSRGVMDTCTCDESEHLQNTEAWLWGGCGDNIKYGLEFSRWFLLAGKRRGKDIRAKVDQHNIRLGRKVVKKEVKTRCKCHGISGSCTVRTCWRQLSTFLSVGSILKQKYESSHKVVTHTNQATGKSHLSELIVKNESGNYVTSGNRIFNKFKKGRRRKKSRKSRNRRRNSSRSNRLRDKYRVALKSNAMVHLDDSPTFCAASRYGPGTTGRVCKHGNCDVMCCGRGYNIRSVVVTRACMCQVHWCCYVECKQCVSEEEMYLCK